MQREPSIDGGLPDRTAARPGEVVLLGGRVRAVEGCVAVGEAAEPRDDVPMVDGVAHEALGECAPGRWDRAHEPVYGVDVAFLFRERLAVVKRLQQEYLPGRREAPVEARGDGALGGGQGGRVVRECARGIAMAVSGELVEQYDDGEGAFRRRFPIPEPPRRGIVQRWPETRRDGLVERFARAVPELRTRVRLRWIAPGFLEPEAEDVRRRNAVGDGSLGQGREPSRAVLLPGASPGGDAIKWLRNFERLRATAT